jgi:multiple sugar transport system permease protein
MTVPFAWMVLTSLKTLGETNHVPPIIFPTAPQWVNYATAVSQAPVLAQYRNTALMALGRVAGQLLCSSLAGYAFARIEFPGRRVIFVVLLCLLMIPDQLALIPLYLEMKSFGWINEMPALIVPGMFSVFGTFLFRQFFMSLPRDLEEAARLDGANQLQIYWHVMLPLVKSATTAVALFTALWSWNALIWPLIVINSADRTTLSAGLATLNGQYTTNYPILMAGSTLAVIPMIVLFIVLQRQFVQGIALTGTRG